MFTPEEIEIAKRAKELGKTREDALAGIAKYRASKTQTTSSATAIPSEPEKKPFSNKVTDTVGLGGATNVFGRMANTLIAKYPNSLLSKLVGQSEEQKEVEAVSGKTRSEILSSGVEAPTGKEMLGAGLQTAAVVGGLALGGPATLLGKASVGAGLGYGYDVGKDLTNKKSTAETLTPGLTTLLGAAGPVLAKGLTVGAGATKSFLSNTTQKAGTLATDTIDSVGSQISAPSVSNATRVSLNPKEALKGTGQDMTVSVGGKLKQLSELTPTENTKMQFSTQKSVNKFTEQAKLFKNNRNPANDPIEIVGKRVDAALDFADKKRQVVGKKMGEIELKYADQTVPFSEQTVGKVLPMLDAMATPKFGVDSADAPIVKKLVKDFFELENSGGTVAERMTFVRSWDKYLNDSKDAFGNFKENATVNTRIQNFINTLKDETVDAISKQDKVYRGLRSQYSIYKQLDEIGNGLLGKDGALGVRIKGGATVKRALKSNSDAGARQFLTKLKELTGYDAIKDGDLALTAMENVGDFQGLSLLEVLKDGKAGLMSRGFEALQNKVVGDAPTRVDKFIKKGS